MAAYAGHAHVIPVLMAGGALIDVGVANSWTALTIAAREGHEDCVAELIKFGADIEKKVVLLFLFVHIYAPLALLPK